MAAQSDKFKKTGASTVTTLAAPGRALGASSITVGSTTNYPTGTGIVIAIRVVDSNGDLVAGTYSEFTATVTSGTTLAISTTPVYGTDQIYAAGSTTQVFIPLSSYAHNQLVDGLVVEHNQDGTHTDITADSLATNTIAEGTAASGVTVDGLLIKDSKLATNNSVVTSNITDGAVTPAKRTGGFYAGTFTISATGNKAITGVGFTPKFVMFDWVATASSSADNNTSGWMTATAQFAKWSSSNSAGNSSARNAYTNLCLATGASASSTANETAAYVSMDADGFTINVTAQNGGTWAFVAYA